MDFWKVEIHPISKAQEASTNRVLGTRRVSTPFPRLPKAVLLISTCQSALLCHKTLLLCATTLLQLTTVLILLLDWHPRSCLCFFLILLSLHGPSSPSCLPKSLDSFLFPTASWQNPSPRWMEPSACFACACARTVEWLELNYTSPWSKIHGHQLQGDLWHSSSRLASADTTLPKRLSQWFWWHCSFQVTLRFSNAFSKC